MYTTRLQHGAAVTGRLFLRRAAAADRQLQPPCLFGARSNQQQAQTLHYTRFRCLSGPERVSASKTDEDTTAAQQAPTSIDGSKGVFGSLPARIALARVGRGCLIALPLAGIGFSAWTGLSDYRRARLPLAEKTEGVDPASRPAIDNSIASCFEGAMMADASVFGFHLIAAFGLYEGWDPNPIVNAEIASLVWAVVSTGCGLRGEYLIAKRDAAQLLGRGARGS